MKTPLEIEIEERFGVLPNFFRLTTDDPEIVAKLWHFAQFAYLDNPLPSLFKERLFVYLSRFCEVRYCIARHLGFLIGLGRPAGDSQSLTQTLAEVEALLHRPLARGQELEPALALCNVYDTPIVRFPAPDSPEEVAISACATHLFLQTADAPRALDALQHILGASRFEQLLIFLAFVHLAHYWTQAHPQLTFEEDINGLLAANETLATGVFNDSELRDKALRDSQAQLQIALDAAQLGTWDLDLNTHQTLVSPRMAELIGFPPEQSRMLPEEWQSVIPGDLSRIDAEKAVAIKGDTPFEREFKILPRGGTQRWLHAWGTVARDDSGRPLRVLGVAMDVTERRHAEETLRQTSARDSFRLALSDTLRPLSDPAEIQAEAARVLGEHLDASRVHYGEILEDGGQAMIHHDYCDGVPSLAGTYPLSAYGSWFLHEFRAGHTTVIPEVANTQYLRIEERQALASVGIAALVAVPLVKGGQWIGLLAVHQAQPREWTGEEIMLIEETAERTWAAVERAYAEAALRASEERLRIAIEAGNIYTWEVDVATQHVIYSDTVKAVLGFALPENFTEVMALLHPDDYSFVMEHYQRVLRGETLLGVECRILNPLDGEAVWVRMQGTLIDDGRGGHARVVGVTRNITQRKQAEEELQRLNKTLESRVEERTRQVRHLVTELTLSEQEERRRISGILHDDLQQRLFSLGFQFVALRNTLAHGAGGEQEDARLLLDEIDQALRESIQVTRNLSVDLSPPVLNNEGLFEAIRWLASQMEQQQGLTVMVEQRKTLPPLHEDLRELLFQIVRELLFNIVKHAGVDKARVTLTYQDNQLCIEVSDKGWGFDPNIQKGQSSQGLTRIGQRLQLIDGYMQIDSHPGVGTRVVLNIPLRGKKGP